MDDKPLVSVIVTTYNRKDLLERTINSILTQTFHDFELIVVDNYSNYDFAGFISSFHSEKIRAFQNQNNGIIAVNRNFGIERAIGKYVAFCDDDDYWMHNKLEEVMKHSNKADFFCHDCSMTNGKHMKAGYFVTDDRMVSMMITGNVIPYSTVVVKKDLIDEVGFFDVSKSLITVEDWDYWMRCLIKSPHLYTIHKELSVYTVSPTNSSASIVAIQSVKNIYAKYSYLLHGFNRWKGYASLHFRLARKYHALRIFNKAMLNYSVSLFNLYSRIMTIKSLGGIVLCVFRIKN